MKNVKKLLYEVVKRLFDIGSSFLAILISSPLWLLNAVDRTGKPCAVKSFQKKSVLGH